MRMILLSALLLQFFGSFAQTFVLPTVDTTHITEGILIHQTPDLEWIIEEGEHELSVDDMQRGNIYDAEIIRPTSGHYYSLGINTYWYKLSLSNRNAYANQRLSVSFEGGNGAFLKTFAKVQAYYYSKGVRIGEGISGLEIASFQRDVNEVFQPSIVNFEIAPDQDIDIWIRAVSDRDMKVRIINVVASSQVDILQLTTFSVFEFIILGSLIAMLVIGIFLYYWYPDKVYRWFLLFIIINLFAALTSKFHNEIISLFLSDHPILINYLLGINDIAKFLVTILFGRVFINTKKKFPRVDKTLVLVTIIFITNSSIITLAGSALTSIPILRQSLFVLVIVSMAAIIFIFGYFIFSGDKLARFYSLAAVTPFLGIIWVLSTTALGFDDHAQWGEVFIGLGPVLAIGLAIVYRFKIVVDEKLEAEEARKNLLAKQNTSLEKEVKSRTLELRTSLSNLKATQAQLIHAEKMASLGELTAGIAHEIQNPLNFVNNFSEVSAELVDEVGEELEKGDLIESKSILFDLKKNINKISHHGNRASSIVKGMLDHSRINRGEKIATDINALCDEYLRLAYHGLRAKNKSFQANFHLDADPDIPEITVVSQDIGRVLLNLINNGFQAIHERSKIDTSTYNPELIVRTRNADGIIEIEVLDNGLGISDEIKDKIFQPFFTTKPTGQGTGLGLSLAYDIVKAHGGSIEVSSPDGKGSAFTIILPA